MAQRCIAELAFSDNDRNCRPDYSSLYAAADPYEEEDCWTDRAVSSEGGGDELPQDDGTVAATTTITHWWWWNYQPSITNTTHTSSWWWAAGLAERSHHNSSADMTERNCCSERSALPTARSASSLASVAAGTDSTSATWDDHAHSTSTTSKYSIKIPSTWTVGKISLVFLLVAAAGDFTLHSLRWQPNNSSSSPGNSGSSVVNNNNRPRSSLGSAAISTVTDALSPILPFTGGVDLRREEYRSSSVWETVQSLYTQTMDAFSANSNNPAASYFYLHTPSLHGGVDFSTRTAHHRFKAERKMALSSMEPFVSRKLIAQLTLSDIAEIFRYAVESNQLGFDESKYLRKLQNPDTRKVVTAMKAAVAESRGVDAQDSVSTEYAKSSGHVDATKFSAVMRIFAEWRLLRQTPEGYKGFEIGMSLGHKDIVQNVAKIEAKVHEWLDEQCDAMGPDDVLRAPTIAQLLEYETELRLHPKLPRLTDRTAAMGLLWVRRQLEYQTRIFINALLVPSKYPRTKDAVVAAYDQVYDRYHGWAVQKIFHYSFQAAPEADEIYRHMNPRRLKEVQDTLRNKKLSRTSSSSSVPTTNDSDAANLEEENWLDHVSSWWHDLTNQHNDVGDSLVNTNDSSTEKDEWERLVSMEMVKDARQHIAMYLQVVEPLLTDLAGVFDSCNMDDPTRV